MNSPLLTRAADIIFSLPIRKLAFWLFVLMIVRCGVWGMGSLPEQTAVTFSLYHNPFPNAYSHYVFWSYLGPLVANVIGINADNMSGHMAVIMLATYYGVLALGGTALFCHLVITRLPDHAARAALLLYFMMPVSGTIYFWLGMDGLTHLLMILTLLYPRHIGWGLFSGFVLGLQHMEQGFVGFGALLVSLLLAGKKVPQPIVSRDWVLGVLGGLILSKFTLFWWFIENDIHINSGRTAFFADHASRIMSYMFLHPQLAIATVFGAAWLAVLRVWEIKELRAAFFLPLLALLPLMFMVEDETRVLALVTFPLVAAWMFFYPPFLEKMDRNFIGLLGILFLVVPWLWVWRGEMRPSVLSYDFIYIVGNLFGWLDIPTDVFMWAFPYDNSV